MAGLAGKGTCLMTSGHPWSLQWMETANSQDCSLVSSCALCKRVYTHIHIYTHIHTYTYTYITHIMHACIIHVYYTHSYTDKENLSVMSVFKRVSTFYSFRSKGLRGGSFYCQYCMIFNSCLFLFQRMSLLLLMSLQLPLPPLPHFALQTLTCPPPAQLKACTKGPTDPALWTQLMVWSSLGGCQGVVIKLGSSKS